MTSKWLKKFGLKTSASRPRDGANCSRLLSDEELSLYALEHFFILGSSFYSNGMKDVMVTCDLLVRDMPPHRNFLVAGGLEAITQYLSNLHYTEDQVQYLLANKPISREFADYLRHFRFSGTVYAMPEGTVHFPGEPMLRITAPIIEANLLTDQLISLAKIDTMLLSKLARVYLASQGRIKIAIGFVRAQGIDAGWRACRNSQFFDNMGFSNAAVAKRLGVVSGAVINANHAFIKSFPSEIEAMCAIGREFPLVTVMVDTYEIKHGIRNAIAVADELKSEGKKLGGITIDSGDLSELAKYARKELDKAGHSEVTISVAGNMDEYKVAKLLAEKVPVDSILVVTEVITSSDAPKLEMVYKMAQMEEGGVVRNTAKFSPGKLSLPGRKQVFRKFSSKSIEHDIIGLESENLGQPLLVPIFEKGKLVYKVPDLAQSRRYVKDQISILPEKLKDLFSESPAPLEISPEIKSLLEEVRAKYQAGDDN